MSERGDGCKVPYKWSILIVTKKQKFDQQFLNKKKARYEVAERVISGDAKVGKSRAKETCVMKEK